MKRRKTAIKAEKVKIKKRQAVAGDISGKDVAAAICSSVFPVVVMLVYQYVMGIATADILQGFIYMSLFALTFGYLFLLALKKNSFSYYNRIHLHRFLLAFASGALLCILQVYLPYTMWMYLPIAIMLTIFSCMQIGMAAFLYLLFFQCMLQTPDTLVFFGFCLIGMIGVVMFGYLDEEFLFGIPLLVSLLFEAVLLLLMDLATAGRMTFDAFLYTAINLFISFFVITMCLKYLSFHVLHKDRDKYQEINDPEYELLTELKKYSTKAYFHAIHTAYFSEKIAKKIGADEMLAKAGGYYHKIGKMRGDQNLKNALAIAKEHEFPPALVELLKEYGGKNTILHSREAAIVIFADAMVSSVTFLFEKDKNATLDYERIANVVFQKQMAGGVLDHCQLTMDELTTIRKTFVEETLYYDFLR